MIAAAFGVDDFVVNDIDKLLDMGYEAVDPESDVAEVIRRTRKWCAENPTDWRATRQLIHDTYTRHKGTMRDRNGYELNTAATVAALIYGQGDYVQTALHAFNFGWDCDNTAATAGTILGVIRGKKWFDEQGWHLEDVYKNTRRDEMPMDETITSFGNRLIELAEKQILASGGKITDSENGKTYSIALEQPQNILSIKELKKQQEATFELLRKAVFDAFSGKDSSLTLAGVAYLAICFGDDAELKQKDAAKWVQALESLNQQEKFIEYIFKDTTFVSAEPLKQKLRAAGVRYTPAAATK